MPSVRPTAVYGLIKELRAGWAQAGDLVVEGPPALAESLRRDLAQGAAPGKVRGGSVDGAHAFVLVLAGPVGKDEEALLRRAARKGVPIVAVLAGPELDPRIPHVLATDVVSARPGAGFPVNEIARALAARLDERGPALAARVPVLREAVCARLIDSASRRSALTGAAVFIPGADLPVIALVQLRMVLRLGEAHGVDVDQRRLPEILAVVGGGYAFRGLARQALRYVPIAGFAVRGTIAYTGTRAIGEAAMRYFAAQAAH